MRKDRYEDVILGENKLEDMASDQNTINLIEKEAGTMRNALKNNPIGKQNWSISEIFQKYKRGELILDPSYQRRGNMWERSKKIEFIESLLLGIFIPPIYVVENIKRSSSGLVEYEYEVVDGKQRISAIVEFILGDPESTTKRKLILDKVSLKYFSDYYGGLSIDQIVMKDERDNLTYLEDFYSHGIDIYVIKSSMPEELRYDIFARLNQGVAKLSPDELRRAIYRTELVEYIESFIETKLQEEEKTYRKAFTRNDIKRYKDLGRFFRSVAYYYSSNVEEKSIDKYNSRPKEMINNILERFKENANDKIEFDSKVVDDILNFTYDIYSEILVENKEKDYIIDASIKLLVDKLIGIDDVVFVSNQPEFVETLKQSKSTTKNMNKRFELMCNFTFERN